MLAQARKEMQYAARKGVATKCFLRSQDLGLTFSLNESS